MRWKLIFVSLVAVVALIATAALYFFGAEAEGNTSPTVSNDHNSCSGGNVPSPDEPSDAPAVETIRTVSLPPGNLCYSSFYVIDSTTIDSQDSELLSLTMADSVTGRASVVLSKDEILVALPSTGATEEDYRLLGSINGLSGVRLPADSSVNSANVSHLAALSQIQYLELGETPNFGGSDFVLIGEMLSLTHLSLGKRLNLTDEEFAYLAPLNVLTSLCLPANGIKTSHSTLLSFPYLTRLRVSYTRSPDLWATFISYLGGLEDLFFLSRVNDSVLGMVKNLSKLKTLSIVGCRKVTGAGLALISQCTSLRDLSLSHGSHLAASGLDAISSMQLTNLELSFWRSISTEGLSALSLLPKLESLSLLRSDGEWSGVSVLANSPSLASLNLDGCRGLQAKHLKGFSSIGHKITIQVGRRPEGINWKVCKDITAANPNVQVVR